MVKMEAFDDSHFMHQAVRVGHTDHTGSIVFPMACIFDLKKKFLCNWTLIKIVLYRRAIAGLGMVKLEAFDDPHFMHQTVRGGHTDHTGSIVFPMACIFDLKKKFLCNWTLIKIILYRRAIALVWGKWKGLTILILCTRLLGVVILITLVASFLSLHAYLILKINFYVTGHCTPSEEGYGLGMVKMEAFDDPHFMHQTVRVCQTDHTGSINACIACSFDLKNNL